MKAVIVCGSRDWKDQTTIWDALDVCNPDLVIHGACKGADTCAAEWCEERSLMPHVPMPAQWKTRGKSAGPDRNTEMLNVLLALRECGYDVEVLAFVLPSSRGTWDMVRKAQAAGLAESCQVATVGTTCQTSLKR